MKCDLDCLNCKFPECIENTKATHKPKKDRTAYFQKWYEEHKYELKKKRLAETLARKGKKKMICENCECEITGNWLKYKGKCFCRKDNDSCFKDWLYDQTDGECEYGTMLDGEEVQLAPSWTEEYLNTLGLSKKDF